MTPKLNYIDQFLDFLQYQRGLSQNTIRSYRLDLDQYFAWLKRQELKPASVKVRDVDSFITELSKNGLTMQSVNRKMYCLKSFYRYLLRIEIVKRNPMEIFKNGKEKKRLPRYLTFEQQKVLLLASQVAKFNPLWVKQRNELMVLFLLDTGLRISELCNLELKNINLDEGIFKVLGKGNKEREVVISDRLGIAIEKYLAMVSNSEIRESTGPLLASRGLTLTAVCTELGIRYCAIQNALKHQGWEKENMEKLQSFVTEKVKPLPIRFLFFNEHGKILCQRHAMRIIKEIGQKAGIEGLHPHILRHSFATNLRERGADLLLLKESLGHASIMTTQIYAHIGNGKYKSELRKFIN